MRRCDPSRMCPAKAGLCLLLATGSFIAAAAPSPPTNVVANAVSATRIDLTWGDSSSDEDGFKIERSTDGTNFTQIAQVLPNTAVYRDSTVWPGTAYSYRVCAFNASGNSTFAGPANASAPASCASTVVNGLPGLYGISSVSGGGNFSLAVESDHTVLGWGSDDYG